MECVILAGGKGTRIKSIWNSPKSLLPINGRPFLDYLLRYLSFHGITRFVISIGYKKELIKKAYENSEYKITWSEEDIPLGTGGAVKKALEQTINRNVFVVNGDTLFTIDLASMMQFHRRNLSFITLAVKQFNKPFGLLPGGITIINSAIRGHLKYHTMFEDLFEDGNYNVFTSKDYFLDIGTPENYERAQREFLKFE